MREFLIEEFWILSWAASVQRANLYRKEADVKDRPEFKQNVIDYCKKNIIPMYSEEIKENQHLDNIQSIVGEASKFASSQVLECGYKVGVAQKLLNLQLKYLWCSGFITSPPPHCPVDRIILAKTSLKGKMSWTKISSISEYMKAIQAIKVVAGKQPLAEWELANFARKSTTKKSIPKDAYKVAFNTAVMNINCG